MFMPLAFLFDVQTCGLKESNILYHDIQIFWSIILCYALRMYQASQQYINPSAVFTCASCVAPVTAVVSSKVTGLLRVITPNFIILPQHNQPGLSY